MNKRHILAALVGAVILFVLEFVWHMFLPFHTDVFNQFQDQEHVIAEIQQHAPENGMYMIPFYAPDMEGKTAEEKSELMEKAMKEMEEGPTAFVVYRGDGGKSFGLGLLIQFLTDFAAMLIAVCFVANCPCQKCSSKICLMMTLLAFGFIVFAVPNWTWWGFTLGYTAVMIISLAINWLIAGTVVIKLLPATPESVAAEAAE